MTDDTLKQDLEASLGGMSRGEFAAKVIMANPRATMESVNKMMEDLKSLPPLPPIPELGEKSPWPAPGSLVHTSHGRNRYYRAVSGDFEGDLPGSTSVLKAVLGLSKDPLIAWATNLEREACFTAIFEAFGDGDWKGAGAARFMRAVQDKLGLVRAHQRALEKAGDLGTQIHSLAEGWLRAQMGIATQEVLSLKPEAELAFLAFKDKWRESGLRPVRMEQVVYDADWGFAGTIDIVAEHPDKGLGVVDLKSSKGIYSEMHLQVASYLKAGRNFADLKWAELWRLPKTASDLKVEVKPLGVMYDRTLSEEQCMQLFRACLVLFQNLCHKGEA